MNEIRQTVWPQSAHFGKMGPQGALKGPITTPLGGRWGSYLAGMFTLSRDMLMPNLIAIAQSWRIPSHRTQNFWAPYPHWGGVPVWGGGCCCTGVRSWQNERDPRNRLTAISTLWQNWAPGGILRPHNSPLRGDGAQIRQACFICQGVCLCEIWSRLLKVGRYIPIEPKILEPHNSLSGVRRGPVWGGGCVFRGQVPAKMNSISSRVSPQSTRLTDGRGNGRTFSR